MQNFRQELLPRYKGIWTHQALILLLYEPISHEIITIITTAVNQQRLLYGRCVI